MERNCQVPSQSPLSLQTFKSLPILKCVVQVPFLLGYVQKTSSSLEVQVAMQAVTLFQVF